MPSFIHPLTQIRRDVREKHPEILDKIKQGMKRMNQNE
jgi:hypothetical protein